VINDPNQNSSEARAAAVRFPDLRTAGRLLAQRLEDYRREPNLVVLAPVLGGVPVGHEIAIHLDKPFDFTVRRGLLAPDINAVSVAGKIIVDENAPPIPEHPSTALEYFLVDAIAQLQTRTSICRGAAPERELANKTVLLVDCGIHTGSTIRSAIKALRRTSAGKIMVAAPVVSIEAEETINELADELVYLTVSGSFVNTAFWFSDFSRPGEHEIHSLLRP
jgi:putative phosphoribosyl transferase